ncbi:fimbrial protein [Serratia marcescens]|uniref:fimbrial protein n=1 Tax=Serratia marcescens TaxID=615 RepID=UPI0013781372|nr:fimbrial protein [Serratia marcescens]NCJ11453.1 fimbrial protein [Serratia marcescens]NDJ01468.1 fimbrial protein [Serratia marcescens]
MIRLIFLLLLSGLFSDYSYATCFGKGISFAPALNVDLSDKLNANTPVWEEQYSTQYVGTFDCSSSKSKFTYTLKLSPDNKNAAIFGFNNGTQWIRAQIVNKIGDRELSKRGEHSAAELNTPMTVRYSLESKPKNGRVVPGDTLMLDDALMVSDITGIKIWELPIWLLQQVGKILSWLLTGNWPYDERDMYGQPMNIKYAPKTTTCRFDNAGLTVRLPKMGVAQVLNNNQPGYTPFSLNISCQNMQQEGIADRAVEMFLSSNNLLASDASVLTNANAGGAQGVGLRLVKRDMASSPVVLSPSNVDRGSATSLFHVAAGGSLNSHFIIGMGAYYYAYQRDGVTQGEINTSATLNIIYP